MAVVGFNFTKIDAEKKEFVKGKININNNVSIKEVEEKDLFLGNQKQKVLSFTFEFISKYDPDIGSIRLIGEVLFMDDSKNVKEILDGWKKDKRLPKETMTNILNTILSKCNVEALILSERINLPPPIPLPKVQVGQKID